MSLIEVKILKPVSGKFGLAFNVGQTVPVGVKQADEMVNLKFAEYIEKPNFTDRIKRLLGL